MNQMSFVAVRGFLLPLQLKRVVQSDSPMESLIA